MKLEPHCLNRNSLLHIHDLMHVCYLKMPFNWRFAHIAIGANSSLTAAAVVVTGLVGANFVQVMLDKLRFEDPIARGIATASR